MKFLLFCAYLFVFAATNGSGQSPNPQSTPSPKDISQQQISNQMQRQREFERLNSVNRRSPRPPVSSSGGLGYGDWTELYRKTTNKELRLLAPKPEDLAKYENILRQPDTGVIKLAADKGCFENPNVVVVTPDCLAFTMPGAGTSYSFRVKDYRIPRLGDITFTDNSFQATGIRLHGFFVKLGDIPLEQVNLQTRGLKFAVDFKAETDFQKAKELDWQLIRGVNDDGYLYRRAIDAADNTTYVLRSIAYRGKFLRAAQRFTYNELDFDKRKDVIIAFRIIRRDDDGSVTILWKQLSKQDSPKIKLNKKKVGNQTVKSNFTAKTNDDAK